MKRKNLFLQLFSPDTSRCGRTAAVGGLMLCSAAAGCALTASAGESATSVSQAAQTVAVKGHVQDENGDPLIGVSVTVKGSDGIGVVTDYDGNFALKTPADASLYISYVGYDPVTVKPVNGRVDVVLKSNSVELDEVVAIGYGTMRKRDLTGAISSVKSDEIKLAPTGNVMEAIQGKVAGLDITRSSGDAGAGVNIQLRGTRSIYGSNGPQFIIDGMPGSYDDINPSDVESIEVLKGASATAIYGSAGANGVIIITTKNAEKGKFRINFDGYCGWNTVSKYPEMNMGESYVNFRREAMRTAGMWNGPEDDANLFPAHIQKYVDQDKWINWFGEGTQTGKTQNYTFNTSYSNDRASSNFSFSYYDVEGILKDDKFQRYTIHANLDFVANPYIKYGFYLNGKYVKNGKRSNRIWNRMLFNAPLGDVYAEDGSLNLYPIEGESTYTNLLVDNQNGVYLNNTRSISVIPRGYVEITPVKGLVIRSVLGASLSSSKSSNYTGPNSYEGLESNKNEASVGSTMSWSYNWQNTVTYKFNIKDIHDFMFTGVTEWAKSKSESSTATAYGFDSDEFGYHNLGAATGVPAVASSFGQSQSMSYALRLNYVFMGRYLASVTSRWDGASLLAEGSKWDVFPAASLGWRISDEPFMRNLRWLNNLKLRAEYGVTGNAGASRYATMAYSVHGFLGFQDTRLPYSAYSTQFGNKDLGWEKSYNWNVGLDMGLLNDRISANVDWYHTRTKDLLFNKPLPFEMGGTGNAGDQLRIWANVGETENVGVEAAITSHNIVTRDFQWTTTLTFATNKNKVLKTIQESPMQFNEWWLIPGEGIHTLYGYKYDGIWGTAEAEEAKKYGQEPGQVRIAENGEADYTLNADDYQILGNTDPKWSGSLLNTLNYKGFDLSFLFITRWDYTLHYGIGGWYRIDGINPAPVICDYWTPENQDARYPRPDARSSDGKAFNYDSANYFDGSYVKVKNITFGYTLPKSLLSKFGVTNARIYFTADNPFVFTKSKYLKYYDPEKGGSEESAPLSKQFVFGLNLSI